MPAVDHAHSRDKGRTLRMNAPSQPSRRRGPFWIVILLILLGGAGYGWHRWRVAEAPKPTARAPEAVPVTLARAEEGAFAHVLRGLGTVQAFNTVQTRTRVDGEIVQIGFREGQVVKKGDLLVQIDPRPFQATLDGARAKKSQDEANLKNIRADLERSTKLGDYASRQQVDTQTASAAQMVAQIASDQASIDAAQTQLGYATVRSPIDGVTGFRQVDVGNIVNASSQSAIVTITQIEPIYVVYTAPETDLPEVTKSLTQGRVSVEAWSSDGMTKLSSGKLDLVNNQVDVATGTLRLKASFENKDHALWPGLSVSTRMTIGTVADALTIPDDAVQHGPNGLFAFVVDEARKAHMAPITVGGSNDGRSRVLKGLTAGDTVVEQGQSRVQEGTLVADPKVPAGASNKTAQIDAPKPNADKGGR